MNINVQDLYGRKFSVIGVDCSKPVNDLKIQIQSATGVPWEEQRLLYGGTELDQDGLILSTLNISEGCTISMINVPIPESIAKLNAQSAKIKQKSSRSLLWYFCLPCWLLCCCCCCEDDDEEEDNNFESLELEDITLPVNKENFNNDVKCWTGKLKESWLPVVIFSLLYDDCGFDSILLHPESLFTKSGNTKSVIRILNKITIKLRKRKIGSLDDLTVHFLEIDPDFITRDLFQTMELLFKDLLELKPFILYDVLLSMSDGYILSLERRFALPILAKKTISPLGYQLRMNLLTQNTKFSRSPFPALIVKFPPKGIFSILANLEVDLTGFLKFDTRNSKLKLLAVFCEESENKNNKSEHFVYLRRTAIPDTETEWILLNSSLEIRILDAFEIQVEELIKTRNLPKDPSKDLSLFVTNSIGAIYLRSE